MTDYKPGQIAMVTADNRREEFRAFFDGWTWRELSSHSFCVDGPPSVRPLVVLDLGPGDLPARDAVASLRRIEVSANVTPSVVRLAEWLADQIEAQTRPAIEEPGLWGVVATGYDDGSSVDYWTRGPGGWFNERGDLAMWGGLESPTLIREGVES